MKELINKITNKFLCCHHWELWKTITVDNYGGTYHVYHFKCTKCGKFKKVKSS